MSRRLLDRGLPLAMMMSMACSLVTAAAPVDRTTALHACAGATRALETHRRSASLDDGRTLLVADGAPVLLSADRRELRILDWPAAAGTLGTIATLQGHGVLVAASHGLWLLDQAGTLRPLTDCQDTGEVHASTRNAHGQVLLRAEKGVFELTPTGALRQLTPRRVKGLLAVPDGRWLAEAGGALYGLNDSGTLVPLLTGAKAARGQGEHVGWRLDSRDASDWARLGPGWLIMLSVDDAPLFVRDDGRVEPLRGPDGRPTRQRTALLTVRDGRVFALQESGLYRLLPGPVWRPVSTAVRLTCIDGAQGSSLHRPAIEVPGRALYTIGQQVFEITPNDEAVLLQGQKVCHQAGGFSAEAGADGWVYLVVDGALYRVGPTRVLEHMPLPAGVQAVADLGVRSVGSGRVIVVTKDLSYEVGSGGQLRPIEHVTSAVAMRGGRLVACGRKSHELTQAVDGVHFEPVAAAAGRRCARVEAALDGSALVSFETTRLVSRIDASRRPTPLPGPRIDLPDGDLFKVEWTGTALRIDASGRATPLPGPRIRLPDGDLFIGRESRALFIDSAGRTTGLDVPAGWAPAAVPVGHRLALVLPLHFLDARRGFGFFQTHEGGELPTQLAVSDDGGSTWRGVRSGDEWITGVAAVSFADDGRSGMAVGAAGRVWATQDGGRSWQRQPEAAPADLLAVWMPGPAGRAYVLAAFDQILRTDDGGKTWSPLPALPYAGIERRNPNEIVDELRRLSFSERGRRLWWIADEGDVLTSTDDGHTWAPKWRIPSTARSTGLVQFRGPGARACLASKAGLFCSDPGSTTLSRQSFVEQSFAELTLAADGLHGWAVGADGLILATTDGGTTWTPQRSGVDQLLQHVFFLPDGQHGWASGEGVLLVTRDGGQTWARVLPRVVE